MPPAALSNGEITENGPPKPQRPPDPGTDRRGTQYEADRATAFPAPPRRALSLPSPAWDAFQAPADFLPAPAPRD
jgi:hypothetical protein